MFSSLRNCQYENDEGLHSWNFHLEVTCKGKSMEKMIPIPGDSSQNDLLSKNCHLEKSSVNGEIFTVTSIMDKVTCKAYVLIVGTVT